MSAYTRHAGMSHMPMPVHRSAVLVRVLFGCVAVVLLFIQAIHPGMHPYEVIGLDSDTHVGCPISHAIADLPPELPPLELRSLVLEPLLNPRLWLSHLYFYHALAPRPPPALHL